MSAVITPAMSFVMPGEAPAAAPRVGFSLIAVVPAAALASVALLRVLDVLRIGHAELTAALNALALGAFR